MNKTARNTLLLFIFELISSFTLANSPEYVEVDKGNKKKVESKEVVTNLQDKKLQDFCNKWYGTKYQYGGCTRSGIDCSCFTHTLYKSVYGIELDRSSKLQYKNAKTIKRIRRLKEGDLVFFKISSFSVNHVGVYIGDKKFIHASTSSGVVISSFDEDYYRKKFHRGGKMSK